MPTDTNPNFDGPSITPQFANDLEDVVYTTPVSEPRMLVRHNGCWEVFTPQTGYVSPASDSSGTKAACDHLHTVLVAAGLDT